jgi:UrcA family protein
MLNIQTSPAVIGVACVLALTAAETPALAQGLPDQMTLVAPGVGPHAQTLAASVNYSDLNLTTKAGQNALRERVRTTAAELCHKIGDEASTAAAFSCEDRALQNAGRYERAAIAQATSQAVLAEAREQPRH